MGRKSIIYSLRPYLYRKGEYMEIKTNHELAQAIEKAIEESGYKKMYIADQIGIKNQNLKRYIYKNNMSLDDANKLLDMIGLQATIEISEK